MHLACSPLWADECDKAIMDYEARKYFANILNLQADRVIGLLDALPGLNLDIQIIAPDHGPLWRQDLGWILDLYRDAAEQKPVPRAVVAYSTMWHATEKLAFALAEGIRSTGVEVKVCDLDANDRSAVMTEVARCGLMAFGAPTLSSLIMALMTSSRGVSCGKSNCHSFFSLPSFPVLSVAPADTSFCATSAGCP